MMGWKVTRNIYEGLVKRLLKEREQSYYKIILMDIGQYAVGEALKECVFRHVSEDILT